MKYLFLVFLFGCVSEKEKKEAVKLKVETMLYAESLQPEGKLFMYSCINGEYYSYKIYRCLRESREQCAISVLKPNDNSILKTAAGVAIGYGAVKMLTGK
jgi:hypothetical protein